MLCKILGISSVLSLLLLALSKWNKYFDSDYDSVLSKYHECNKSKKYGLLQLFIIKKILHLIYVKYKIWNKQNVRQLKNIYSSSRQRCPRIMLSIFFIEILHVFYYNTVYPIKYFTCTSFSQNYWPVDYYR